MALLDADGPAARGAAESIRAAVPGARVLPLEGDVTREADARRLVDEAAGQLGGLHTLVNVAGVRVYVPLAEATEADWERIIGVNVLGTAHCCKAALPRMRAPGAGPWSTSRRSYGLMGRTGWARRHHQGRGARLTRALAVEEAPHRMRVNAVCPGGTITPYHIRRAAARGYRRPCCAGSATPGQPPRPVGRAARGSVSRSCSCPPTSRRSSPAPRSWWTRADRSCDRAAGRPVVVRRGSSRWTCSAASRWPGWCWSTIPARGRGLRAPPSRGVDGFTPTDMIFPFFLFIVGVVDPARARPPPGGRRPRARRRVLRRGR